jgi:phosphoserine phosphatase RsbU/P
MTPTELHVTLPAEPASARRARRFVADALERVGAEAALDSAVLLTSELVTNAVLHARTELMVRVSLADDPAGGGREARTPARVRIEVVDRSPAQPERRTYGAHAGTGRGLVLVEALAASWGTTTVDGGKSVWFEVDTAPDRDSALA